MLSENHQIYRFDVVQFCKKNTWCCSSSCKILDDDVKLEEMIVDRPYCRECFSTARRKLTTRFMQFEDEVARCALEAGMTARQTENIQAAWRQKLKVRLQKFDEQAMGRAKSTARKR